MSLSLSSVTVYPVKSSAGLSRERAEVLAAGLEHDRRWMLVDSANAFITGREYPALVRVRATPLADGGLALEAPGQPDLTLENAGGDGSTEVEVWRDQVDARFVDARADAWLSGYLGVACRLVRIADERARRVDPDYAEPGDHVSFADGYPLLLIGDASLADLNEKAPGPAEMARFRPNLTVSGAGAYAEDGWRRVRVGAVEFDVVKPCDRCVMTTVDPATGVKNEQLEPLRTLSTYRRDRSRGILFGVNLIPRSLGQVSVGDEVEVLA